MSGVNDRKYPSMVDGVQVKSYGGLDKAKLRCYPTKHLTMESYHTLKQAIIDVESCL